MRKTLWIIVTIAVLGTISVYAAPQINTHNNPTVAGQVSVLNLGDDAADPSPSSTPTPKESTTSVVTNVPVNIPTSSTMQSSGFKDGTYTGNSASNRYGIVQVAISISGGKITAVNFLSMPGGDSHSMMLSSYAQPILQANTLTAQNANIDTVSGATYTSMSYKTSLQSAIDQAKA